MCVGIGLACDLGLLLKIELLIYLFSHLFLVVSNAQRLHLALYSGIIPGLLRGPYRIPGFNARLTACKESLSAILLL